MHEEQKIHQRPSRMNQTVIRALGMSFAGNLLFVLIVGLAIGPSFVKLLAHLPEQLQLAGRFAYMAVPWIGLATLISAFRLKTR